MTLFGRKAQQLRVLAFIKAVARARVDRGKNIDAVPTVPQHRRDLNAFDAGRIRAAVAELQPGSIQPGSIQPGSIQPGSIQPGH